MGKTPHTAVKRGTRVLVRLKNGEEFVDKFIDRTGGKRVIFERHRPVSAGDITAFSPWKHRIART